MASTGAVLKRAQELAKEYTGSTLVVDPQDISLESIEAAFLANDPLARRVVAEAGHHLGSSIASLIGTLNIRTIVLTGEMVRFGETWLQSVRESMMQAALTRMAQDTQLEIGKLEFRGCILGASASMLLDDYSLLLTPTEVY